MCPLVLLMYGFPSQTQRFSGGTYAWTTAKTNTQTPQNLSRILKKENVQQKIPTISSALWAPYMNNKEWACHLFLCGSLLRSAFVLCFLEQLKSNGQKFHSQEHTRKNWEPWAAHFTFTFSFYTINVQHGLNKLSQRLPLCSGADSLETGILQAGEDGGCGWCESPREKETSARVDGTLPNINITSTLQMLLPEFTVSREKSSPFLILAWIHRRHFRTPVYPHLLLSALSVKHQPDVFGVFLQRSSSSLWHKDGFKDSRTPMLMLFSTFKACFQLKPILCRQRSVLLFTETSS